jgi:hypothetical protein
MNALTSIDASPPVKRITPVLSPDLNSRLYGEGPVEEIANCLSLREEARAVLPVLLARVRQPAGTSGVRQVIGERFALFPQPDRSDGEWSAWWSDYFDALGDVPWGVLEEAMRRYVRSPGAEFMPKPGKLLEFCSEVVTADHRAAQRAKLALSLWDEHERRQPMPPRPVEAPEVKTMAQMEAERKAVHRMAQQTLAELRAASALRKERPNVDLPSIAGKPDETGITPELRRLVERQRAERGEA